MEWILTTTEGDIEVGYFTPIDDMEVTLVNLEMINGELTFVGNR